MADRPDLAGKRILLLLSGGVACYKAAEATRLLGKAGATVQVVMTEAAEHFITAVTMQALSGRAVVTSQWDAREPNNMAHINLTREADAIVVAPASADFIAKLVHGEAGDLASLLCLARPVERCPLLVAPAMNREMWAHPATQRNIRQLRADGAQLLGPAAGDQACGETGDGRMIEAEELLDEVVAYFQPKRLAGERVLVTAGPTFEAIDPVRGITNLSSGKMGFAVARAAREAGAEVTLVAGPVHLPTPRGVKRIDVVSAQQMHDAVLPLAPLHTVFVATAAVADWRPRAPCDRKIKKDASGTVPSFDMTENPDILAAVARLPAGERPYCVGFAAESHNVARHARDKLARKGVPLIVGNIGPATFGRDDNALLLVDAAGDRALRAGRQADAGAAAGGRDRRPPRRPRRRARQTPHEAPHRPAAARRPPGRTAAGLRHGRQRRARPARLHRPAAAARARRRRADTDRPRHPHRRCAAGGGDPAALGAGPPPRRGARQPGRADRLRLPGAARGELLEPWQRGLHGAADGAHRAARLRAGGAGAISASSRNSPPRRAASGGFGSTGRG